MASKVGIIGGGNVGSALHKGLQTAGYESSVSDRNTVAEVARSADIVILAVAFAALDDVVNRLASSIKEKNSNRCYQYSNSSNGLCGETNKRG